MHYRVEGRGPPLLLISGLGASSVAWSPVLSLLVERYRCITFDSRGTGLSEAPATAYGIDDLADDASALLDHLDLGAAHVIGWSLGGSVLQSLLIRHPDRIARAVLLNAFPSYSPLQHAWLDCLLALRASGADKVAQQAFALAWGFSPAFLVDHARAMHLARIAADLPAPTSNDAFAAQAAALRRYDSRDRLATVSRPVLVLVGAEDILTPVAQSAEIASLVPGARLQVLPAGGHRMVHEYPRETIAAIDDFLIGALPAS
jgi:pimeloyl-ACP methyl ester carboxylesterase